MFSRVLFRSSRLRGGVGAHPRRWSCALEPSLSLGKALKTIVGDGLPRRRVGDVSPPARAHARIAVKRPHAHAHLCGVVGIAAEEVRPAFAAEALLESAVGMAPSLDQVLALQ